MNDNIFKLIFQASANGFSQVINQTQTLHQKVSKLAQGASILGSAFGQVGGAIGRAFGMFLQGGIWGAAAECMKLIIDKTGILKRTTDELNASLETSRKRFEEIKARYADSISAIDQETERKKRQIEITKNQTKAELELAAAKAKAAGDGAKAAKLAGEIAKVEGEAEKKTKKLTVEQADKNLAAARKAASTSRFVVKQGDNRPGMSEGDYDKAAWSKEYRRLTGEIVSRSNHIKDVERQNTEAVATAGNPGGGKKASDENIDELKKALEATKEARKTLVESAKHEREIARNLKQAVQDRKDAITIEKTTDTAAKAGVVTAITNAREEEAKRLGARIAAENAKRQEFSRAPAGGSFAEHFELWRDPAAAEAAQDAAKAKTADFKRFQQAVNRYGGKGKIDEAAALMRQGDEAGLQERLAAWRKSPKFSGQTEQMVLAAAAQQNEKASERSLANIEKNTADLAKKLDELMKAK